MRHRIVKFLLSSLVLLGLVSCQPATQEPTQRPGSPTQPPPAATVAPSQQPEAPKDLVIVIPEDPPSFNAVIADSGYDALAMHLALLGLTEIDPSGKVYPVLAASLLAAV